MSLSEPASKSWFVKVAPPPRYSMHPHIPSADTAVRVAVNRFIQCKLEIPMRFSRVAFFSEY